MVNQAFCTLGKVWLAWFENQRSLVVQPGLHPGKPWFNQAFGARVMSGNFFIAGYFFSQEFICILFSSRNQSAGHFFLKSPITPSKVNGRPLISTKQLTDSDLSIISKGF